MTGFAMVAAVAVIGMAAGLLARSRHEKKYFVTDPYTIYSDKLRNGEKNFVFLSDLHNNIFGADNEALIREIDRIRPDAVLLGGDMMICGDRIDLRDFQSFKKSCRPLSRLLRKWQS